MFQGIICESKLANDHSLHDVVDKSIFLARRRFVKCIEYYPGKNGATVVSSFDGRQANEHIFSANAFSYGAHLFQSYWRHLAPVYMWSWRLAQRLLIWWCSVCYMSMGLYKTSVFLKISLLPSTLENQERFNSFCFLFSITIS